ncbi:MAG: S8 family serine peptidase [Leeuwenhoekiella sp.]
MALTKIGENNFYDDSKFGDLPRDIIESKNSGYFIVFEEYEYYKIISATFNFFGKKAICIYDYLDASPARILNDDEALFFQDIKVAYTRLSEDQIKQVKCEKRSFGVTRDGSLIHIAKTESYKSLAKSTLPKSTKGALKGKDEQIDPYWATCYVNLSENYEFSGKGINVAILDTGLQTTHEHFKQRQNIEYQSFVNETVDDAEGHGTFCAGLLAGGFDQGNKRIGVAYNANLYVGKVKHRDNGDTVNLIKGIFWALRNKCRIISISQEEGDDGLLEIYRRAISFAKFKGALCFVPAGNGSNRPGDENKISVPGRCPEAITISAIDKNYVVYARANRACQDQKIDYVAPGVNVYSTLMYNSYKTNIYGYDSGTSMAVPLVAGLATLLCEKYPKAAPQQIIEELDCLAIKKNDNWIPKDYGRGIPIFKN